ncbi:O-antigen ligase family protein [Novosphingobium flavum]|uniref:O-antigen ligase family protein n=1 Tax=Novosphingobium aerophilum TaxID=2839843 RepID=UPI001639FDF8|nr:O-antigen ligase family protein [Novosphingobium aerophilum]MBC2662458.1 O-antigen ligase family protein [Novosphingobium aerophilum]
MSYRRAPAVIRQGKLVVRRSSEDPAAGSAAASNSEVPPQSAELPKLSQRRKLALLLTVLFTVIPFSLKMASLRLTPMIIMLIIMIIPMTFGWLRRRYGSIVLSDLLVAGFSLWSALALIVNHGSAEAYQPAGIAFLSSFGAYLLGRVLVRDRTAWHRLSTMIFVTLIVLTPFLVFESITGTKPLLKLMSLFGGGVPPVEMNRRMGFARAQGSFEHPILLGIFVASLMSITAYSLAFSLRRIGFATSILLSSIGVVCTLSTGPLLSLNIQFFLIIYARIFKFFKSRWKFLLIFVFAMYFVLDIFTNRSPFHTFVHYATFSSQSSYNRILIWQYGTESVRNHFWFGIGLGEWERPRFMSGSMDNFWLVQAVRYGFPAFLMYAGAFLVGLTQLAKADLRDEQLDFIRQGMIFSLVGTMVAAVSVHLWNASYIWLNFLLGATIWLFTGQQPDAARVENERQTGSTPSRGKPSRSRRLA